jgi:hypothetical protein
MKCPGCGGKLRLRPEFAGKRIKCPRCKTAVSVPVGVVKEIEPVTTTAEPEAEELVTAQKPKKKIRPPVLREEPEQTDEELDDAPAFKSCPKCRAKRPKRVNWTVWGSFYGPALFNHVRCRRCGYAYNGKTGGSNLIPAILFVTIPVIGILAVLGFVGWMIYSRYFLPHP